MALGNCVDCRFWKLSLKQKVRENKAGYCRYNPPAVGFIALKKGPEPENYVEELFQATNWPVTTEHQWCGRFESDERG